MPRTKGLPMDWIRLKSTTTNIKITLRTETCRKIVEEWNEKFKRKKIKSIWVRALVKRIESHLRNFDKK